MTPPTTVTAAVEPVLPRLEPDAARRHDPFPLTDIQRAYWLGRNPAFELGRVGIHVYEEIDADGLDLERLDAAWHRVVSRHDMLRAVVLPSGDQRILPAARYSIEVRDLRGADPQTRQRTLLEWRDALSHRVYAPAEWPMFSIVACRLDEDLTRVLVSVDALNVDMGSFKIVFGEWMALYREPARSLPELTLSYRDYAIALDAMRSAPASQRSATYWRERAARLPPAPDLPLTQPFNQLTSQRFSRRGGRLEAGRWTALKQLAARYGLTPSGVTLAAYHEVLAAWSRSPEFTINVTLFNRLPLHPQVAQLVGDFTSIVLLWTPASPDDTRADRARRLQRQLWADVEHRWVSGVQTLRDVARVHGRSGGEALMPCVFTSTLSDRASGLLPLHALGRRVYSSIQTPQVSLDLHVSEDGGDLVYDLDAVEALYPPGLLDDMFAAYGALLDRLASADAAWTEPPRTQAPAVHLARRRDVNETGAPFRHVRIEDACAAGGARDPAQPAIIASDRVLTYAELDAMSGAAAAGLLALGVGRDRTVGIAMCKGWQQIPAVLAVLRAGGAYVPIDPEWPAARQEQILGDAGVEIVITQEYGDCRTHRSTRRVVTLNGLSAGATDGARRAQGSIEDLAYVLYTSGSTGVPKGAMIEHRSVVNRIDDVNARFGVDRPRVLALTALHHDLSVYDVFGTLAAGGAIVVPEAARLPDPRHWLDLVDRHGVTLWNSVPAYLEMLVSHLEAVPADVRRARSLRLIMLSGDWIPVPLAARIRALLPDARLISLGGPTETTVWDIAFPIEAIDPAWRRIPYGRPLANATYHVLDAALEPRPDWVAGELYIGGTGLARGYYARPDLTAERFVTHPRTGERLFRSGDLGRALPDGTIEILGRVDHQVKVRGQRIETGEIEHVLRRHPLVADALVVATGESDRDRRLVAYVVAAHRSAPPTEAAVSAAASKSAGRGIRHDLDGRACVALPAPPANAAGRETRRSSREFSAATLSLETFAGLLACLRPAAREQGALPKYRYPSAGALYPVQVYAHVKDAGVDGLDEGFYYYHPARHALVRIAGGDVPADAHVEHNRGIAASCGFTLFFVGALDAIEPVYGARARDYCLVEAGCMTQLLMEAAPALGIGVCPIGELRDAALAVVPLFDERHVFLVGLAGGTPAADTGGPLEQRLRAAAAEALPAHMVPSSIVVVDSFPLSPNGKVDRTRLPGPSPAPAPGRTLAGSAAERTVAEAIREIVGVERPSFDVRFLDLGANSLHLVQMSGALTQTVGFDVPVMWLLEHSTVRALARRIDAARKGRP